MIAIDTNILIYTRDPRDTRKQAIAVDLIGADGDFVLLWQVACEFVAASRKLPGVGYGEQQAWQDILTIAKIWPLRMPSQRVLPQAAALSATHSLSTWDALLLAACLDAGVETLYTEDLQTGRSISGVQIVNPFDI